MGAAHWEALVVTGAIFFFVESDWLSWVDIEQLLHVEDLDTVVHSLTTNNHEVVLPADLAPRAGRGVLREASQIRELALLGDLGECSTILLPDGDKFASIVGCPS
jgi:hypothetical protein